jgi:hypothetical protein
MSIDVEYRNGYLGAVLYRMIEKYLSKCMVKVICPPLRRIEKGRLTIEFPDGTTETFGKEQTSTRHARIYVNDYGLFTKVAFGGEIGLGEAYVRTPA